MKNTIPELDKLFEEAGAYRSTEDYSNLLQFVKKFRNIAPYNAMLLHIQKPGSTYVASVQDWRNNFGRRPTPGARPLIILRPFGPVAFVYELADTEGIRGNDAVPDEILKPFKADGDVTKAEFDDFIESMLYAGIRFFTQDFGTDLAGFIQVSESSAVYKKKKQDGSFDDINFRVPFSVVVNSKHDRTTQMATMYHELGHLFCGHLQYNQVKFLPERYSFSENQIEFEAESVCWLLCERQGIKNPSAEYLSGYLDNNKEIPNISIETVLKAVGAIEQIRNGMRVPRKELIRTSAAIR